MTISLTFNAYPASAQSKKRCLMKNKLAQLYVLVSKIDQRYIQPGYLVVMECPTDGGGTGR